ncbi:hypothetical protein ABBQ32_004787 [Trebouxia sp. C0010 RCD-2024]
MPCNRQAPAQRHEKANDLDSVALGDDMLCVNGNRAARTSDGRAYSVPATLVSGSPSERRQSEQSVAELPELPSEGILRSYAASQQLQIERQDSRLHYSVLPFLRTVSLEQALLTHVPYILIKEQQTLHCAAGRAAAAA